MIAWQRLCLITIACFLTLGTGDVSASAPLHGEQVVPGPAAHAATVQGMAASIAVAPVLSPIVLPQYPSPPRVALALAPSPAAGWTRDDLAMSVPVRSRAEFTPAAGCTAIGGCGLAASPSRDVSFCAPPTCRVADTLIEAAPGLPASGLRWISLAQHGGLLLAQGPPSNDAQGAGPTEQQREADVARQLANPISSLISVPFQQNIEFGIGPNNAGWHDLMNIQPVVPFSLTDTWNLVARMIMPVIYQNEIFPGAGSQFGIGDTTFQFFFSPKAPTPSGLIWGVGPLLFVPSGAYLLSTSTWGAGIDAVALKQVPMKWMGGGILTYGLLATQVWPVSGPAPISSVFMQPFVAYTLKNTVTLNLQSQTTYNWTQNQWTVPVIASVSKIYEFGSQLVSIGGGLKYYAVRPVTAPQWGVQFTVTLLFPTKQ